MLTQDQLREVIGTDAYTEDGEKIGKIGHVYVDDDTEHPIFATVHTGLLGTKESFVPIVLATFNGTRLTVPYTQDTVKGAPSVDPDEHLAPEEVETLYRYYDLDYPVAAQPNDGAVTGTAQDHMGTPLAQTRQVRLRRQV